VARKRRHTREFKLAALARLESASDVRALAAELGVNPGLLYKWNSAFRRGGASALRLPGERVPEGSPVDGSQVFGAASGGSADHSGSAPALEHKVAQQALELDFFRAALQHFAGRRRSGGGSGETGSTP
jgi:transposase-like protein